MLDSAVHTASYLLPGSLVAGTKPRDFDAEMQKGRQLRGMGSTEELTEAPLDPSQFIPPHNTPLSNAQGLPGSQVLGNPFKPNLPVPGLNAPGINQGLQQKLLQQQMSKQAAAAAAATGQPVRGQLIPSVHQQFIQQHIVQQLQMAVQAGLISPKVLNQALTPAMLIILQQLLQLQQILQQLITQQQIIQQNRNVTPSQQRQQLEQIAHTIGKIQNKIQQTQQALAKAATQQQLANTSATPADDVNTKELLKELPAGIESMQIKQETPSQVQSRLHSQWKLPSPEREAAENMASQVADQLKQMTGPASNRANPSQTSPNLQMKPDGSGLPLTSMWMGAGASTSTSSPWPTNSSTMDASPTTSTATSTAPVPVAGQRPVSLGDERDSQTTASSVQSTSSDGSTGGAESPNSGSALDIEEFVPGKPWTGGTSAKNIEDDPYITPGSVAMRSQLSISTIKEDYILSSLGKSSSTSSSPSSSNAADSMTVTSSWSPGASGQLPKASSSSNLLGLKSSWSTTPTSDGPSSDGNTPTSGTDDPFGGSNSMPKNAVSRHPPGLPKRSASCPGGDRFLGELDREKAATRLSHGKCSFKFQIRLLTQRYIAKVYKLHTKTCSNLLWKFLSKMFCQFSCSKKKKKRKKLVLVNEMIPCRVLCDFRLDWQCNGFQLAGVEKSVPSGKLVYTVKILKCSSCKLRDRNVIE